MGEIHGMPVKHGIDVIEHSCAGHEDFGPFRFLGGGAVNTKRAGNLLFLHQVLDRQRSPHRSAADQVVAAAVTGGDAILARLLLWNRLVAQARQSVILEQDANDRLALSVFRHEGRGNTGGFFAGDGLKPFFFKMILEIRRRLDFQQRNFGQVPELLGDLLDCRRHFVGGLEDFVLRRSLRPTRLGKRLRR